jgi:hypothetical protein
MVRNMTMGLTLCLGSSLCGSLVKVLYFVSVLNSSLLGVLLVAMGLSIWLLRYPQPDAEAWFYLFWVTLGLVLGVGI